MTSFLVGFDSAWTPANSGAIVGVLQINEGCFNEICPPISAEFGEAKAVILNWQSTLVPKAPLLLLD